MDGVKNEDKIIADCLEQFIGNCNKTVELINTLRRHGAIPKGWDEFFHDMKFKALMAAKKLQPE